MTESSRPRHRPEAGYARGEETRRRIIDVAIRLFGERGYEGASTRDIARLAEVNAPALQYYFDGKEGLYQACAKHIAERTLTRFKPVLDQAEALLATQADRETLIEAFGQIQDTMADHLLSNHDDQSRRLFLAQEQAGHGPAMPFDIMGQTIKVRMYRVGTDLISRITGQPADAPLTKIRLMTLHGQLIFLHVAHQSMLSTLGWERVDAQGLALIKATVREQTRVLMDSWQHGVG